MKPEEIEKKSFEIITEIIGDRKISKENEMVIKRVIHTSADFDYIDNLVFSDNAVSIMKNIIRNGVTIVTDTKMAKAGINKKALSKLNGEVHCFIDNEEVAMISKSKGTTRSAVSVEYAFQSIKAPLIFVIGNAPTSLIKLYEIIKEGKFKPSFIIGVPVGFVNVVESKELIMSLDIPHIISKGRKGGSNVAAAICNAIIYEVLKEIGEQR